MPTVLHELTVKVSLDYRHPLHRPVEMHAAEAVQVGSLAQCVALRESQ